MTHCEFFYCDKQYDGEFFALFYFVYQFLETCSTRGTEGVPRYLRQMQKYHRKPA